MDAKNKEQRNRAIVAHYESFPEELRSIKYTAKIFGVSTRTVNRALKNQVKKI